MSAVSTIFALCTSLVPTITPPTLSRYTAQQPPGTLCQVSEVFVMCNACTPCGELSIGDIRSR
ncbi:putative signal peptide protein [Puccinia sorghi]|uniref:Putative signal peptide protein n=1 Tax=Puccinia sorghi TaxID=27349 RepID=A0A0L6UDC4_9BASI|nr:putative signal peptide protein [Puccinia sorghi]